MTAAVAGSSLYVVADVGHASATLSGVATPHVVGCYLSVGSVVVPVGALGGPSVRPALISTDLSSVGTI